MKRYIRSSELVSSKNDAVRQYNKQSILPEIPAKIDPYQRTFIVRNKDTGYPIEHQTFMTLREAIGRLDEECDLNYISKDNLEIYDTQTMEIVL